MLRRHSPWAFIAWLVSWAIQGVDSTACKVATKRGWLSPHVKTSTPRYPWLNLTALLLLGRSVLMVRVANQLSDVYRWSSRWFMYWRIACVVLRTCTYRLLAFDTSRNLGIVDGPLPTKISSNPLPNFCQFLLIIVDRSIIRHQYPLLLRVYPEFLSPCSKFFPSLFFSVPNETSPSLAFISFAFSLVVKSPRVENSLPESEQSGFSHDQASLNVNPRDWWRASQLLSLLFSSCFNSLLDFEFSESKARSNFPPSVSLHFLSSSM